MPALVYEPSNNRLANAEQKPMGTPSGSTPSLASSSGSGSLTAAVIRQSLAVSAAKASAVSDINVSRELGLELEETMYANRLLALTNPGKYHEERETRFKDLKTSAEQNYKTVLDQYLQVGLPTAQAQALALQAAAQTRDTMRQVIDLQFPASANIVGDASLVRQANPYGGLIPPPPARRARRAPARRRRR